MKCKAQLSLFQKFSFSCLFVIGTLGLTVGCKSTLAPKVLQPSLKAYLNQGDNHFNGLLVVDPSTSDTLIKHNHNRYFIPASNVKIFTFYTGIKLLRPRVPALKYELSSNTLYVLPTGNPTFLNPNFQDSTAYHFLKKFKKIALISNNYQGEKFMPGWSWEDYPYYFSPEVTAFPIHRNVVQVSKSDSLQATPRYFKSKFSVNDDMPYREQHANSFNVPSSLTDTLQIPFITSEELTVNLLANVLETEVETSTKQLSRKQVLHGMPTDSLYKQMLWESDNFTAEQLMLLASSNLSDTLSFKRARDYVLQNHLQSIKNQPRWVDGSGLSRYNLFTPASFVGVLEKLKEEVAENRLFQLFPIWNAAGTQQNPSNEENHFIYAKSGSFGNVYNLSGYLKTNEGKVFLFSFMNNNFRKPSREIRQQMYALLKSIQENY